MSKDSRKNQTKPTVIGSIISRSSAVAPKENLAVKPSTQANVNSAVSKESVASPREENAVNPLPINATLQQQRAYFTLMRIQKLAELWKDDPKKQKQFNNEFNSYASAMPFMIHANGLGQTAAFYRRKGTDHTYYQIYKLLGDWLSQPGQPFYGKPDLLEGVTQSDLDHYLAAQAEALLFLDWVKKLSSAFLDSD